MRIRHIKSADIKVNNWSGGTSMELFIFPEDAIYANRDFEFRISTATVDIPESTFTNLPNYNRTIMVLDGHIEICHKGRYKKHLRKFDTDNFAGDWDTTSIGIATDFNVMTSPHFTNDIEALTLKEGAKPDVFYPWVLGHTLVLYLNTGQIVVDTGNEKVMLEKGDLFVVNALKMNDLFSLKAVVKSEVIVVRISTKE